MHDSRNREYAGPEVPSGRPAVQDNIPPSRQQRESLLEAIRQYVAERCPVPPLSFAELHRHTQELLATAGLDAKHTSYAAVLVNNDVWRDTLARVPFTRRLLLLPQCLRKIPECPARIDEFGLLCQGCGRCLIGELKTQAERLGYVVLVAEGTAVVMSIIESGKIEGIVGLGCLSSLQRVYPYMEAAAIPAVAIPLLCEGCRDTYTDIDWLWEAIRASSQDGAEMLDMDYLRGQVDGWFSPQSLRCLLGEAASPTQEMALAWLSQAGKRWRPLLATCAYQAFRKDASSQPEEDFRKVAVAVECFHKASLIHDDIEDADTMRYGQKTLHERWGVPMALNVGDLLIGEGYRLIAACKATAGRKQQMLMAAATGHRELCIGQGQELWWVRNPRPLSSAEVIEIFRRKTAPAFEVALRLGAIYAGASRGLWPVFGQYSQALGIAYQIRDDLDDLHGNGQPAELKSLRPSVLMALAHESAQGQARERIEQAWREGPGGAEHRAAAPPEHGQAGEELLALMRQLEVEAKAQRLLEHYQQLALSSLEPIEDPLPKRLLRRVISGIFNGSLARQGAASSSNRDSALAAARPHGLGKDQPHAELHAPDAARRKLSAESAA